MRIVNPFAPMPGIPFDTQFGTSAVNARLSEVTK